MSVYDLLIELRDRKVKLWVRDGALCFSAPRDSLDEAIKLRMAEHKSALIDLLGNEPQPAPEGTDGADRPSGILSFAQERLLFLHRMDSESAAYNVPVAVRISGTVDKVALEAAFEAVIARHEAFRTRFELSGAEPRCEVMQAAPFRLEAVTLAHLPPAAREEELLELRDRDALRLFDLTSAPLLRAKLVEMGRDDHALLICMHHLVSDGWSIDILWRDLWSAYEALFGGASADLPPAAGYSAFADEQRRWLASDEFERQKSYWITQLSGMPDLLDLPTDRPRPPVQSFAGAIEQFQIPEALLSAAEKFGRQSGASLYMVLATAFSILLGRYAGARDIAIGMPVANRSSRRWEDSLGFFSNVAVLRTRLTAGTSCRQLADKVRDAALEALTNQAFPFEQAVEHLQPRRSLSHSPLFQVMLMVEQPVAPRLPAGLQVEPLPPRSTISKFDLTLTVRLGGKGAARGGIEYSSALFDASTISRLGDHFCSVLRQMCSSPDADADTVELLGDSAYRELSRRWNDSETAYDRAALIHELIEAQAGRTPGVTAVTFDEKEMSYAALDAEAAAVAACLLARGIGPEARVGVYLERSAGMVAALLGILKSGAAYVPLDPKYPAARIDAIRGSAGLDAIVTTSDLSHRLGDPGVAVVNLDSLPAAAEPPADQPRPCADNLAYVIYTSGSTGEPKGVMVSHRNVVNLFEGLDRSLAPALPRDPQSGRPVWMALTSISFDISVLELLWTLARGHHVVLQTDHLTALAAEEAQGRGLRAEMSIEETPGGGASSAPDFSLFYFASDEDSQSDKYRLLMHGARFADSNGFSAVWVPERHFHAFGGQFANPSVAAAAVAAVTNRIQVRAGSCVLPLHDPIRIAEEWSMVDNLSHGRAAIAFASGWHFNDFVLAPQNFADRHKVMREGIDTVRRLWSGGTIRRTDGLGNEVEVGIRPRPIQPQLPLWITSAASPETFRYAGEIGANVLTHLLGQSLPELRDKIALYRAARAEHGHDPAEGKVTLMLHTFVGEDLETVREAVREPFKNYLRTSISLLKPVAESEGLDAGNDLELVVEAGFNRYFTRSALFGTPESCVALVEDVCAIGVDEIACLIDFGVDPDLVLASFGALARLRQTTAQRWADRTERARSGLAECTHIQCTPSFAKLLVEQPGAIAALQGIQGFLVGGEALPPALARKLKSSLKSELFNMYGPTETTVWSAVQRIDEDEPAIGAPISNTQLHVLDDRLKPVPAGIKGELFIGGDGVTRGYWGRPDLTAERFLPDFLSGVAGSRLYRTGDLVRRREDGSLQFLGRGDGQVKVRGFRVELGDIEAALLAHPGVAEAVAVVRDDEGQAAVFAYVVPAPTAILSIPDLLDALRARLPDYMVPSALVPVQALPLTPNGKVDRKALPEPNSTRSGAPVRELPRNSIEAQLSGIWCELLKLESVGINENFFELGGHSLLLGRLQQMLAERLGREVGIIELFKYPTIAALTHLFVQPEEASSRSRKAMERSRAKQEAAGRAREQMKARRRHG